MRISSPRSPASLAAASLAISAAALAWFARPAAAKQGPPPERVVASFSAYHHQLVVGFDFRLVAMLFPDGSVSSYRLRGTSIPGPGLHLPARLELSSAEMLPAATSAPGESGGFTILRKGAELCSVVLQTPGPGESNLIVSRDGGPRVTVRCNLAEWAMLGQDAPDLPRVLAVLTANCDVESDVVSPCQPSFAHCIHQARLQCFPMRPQVSYACDPATGFVRCSWDCTPAPPPAP